MESSLPRLLSFPGLAFFAVPLFLVTACGGIVGETPDGTDGGCDQCVCIDCGVSPPGHTDDGGFTDGGPGPDASDDGGPTTGDDGGPVTGDDDGSSPPTWQVGVPLVTSSTRVVTLRGSQAGGADPTCNGDTITLDLSTLATTFSICNDVSQGGSSRQLATGSFVMSEEEYAELQGDLDAMQTTTLASCAYDGYVEEADITDASGTTTYVDGSVPCGEAFVIPAIGISQALDAAVSIASNHISSGDVDGG